MDFPEISMISDFEAGVKCLQNPSLISRFFSLSSIERAPQVYSFWKWGALILAIVATFSSLIRRIKLLFIYVRTLKPSAEPLLQYLGEDFDISDDDDDDKDECSSSLSSGDEIDQQIDEDFTVAGSRFYFREQGQNRNLRVRRRRNSFERFPWVDFSAGKSVVKLWDSLALGLDYEGSCRSVVSIWDLNKEQKISNFFSGGSQVPSVAVASPSVVLSSEVIDDSNGVVVAAYDARMKSQSPAICAEWATCSGKLAGVDAGNVVYVKDDSVGILAVGDMRNVKTPTVTEHDGDTWWDSNAVIIEDENIDGSK